MLLRPPLIHEEDIKSQSSNQVSSNQRQKTIRSTSKNRKKQTTIGLAKKITHEYNQIQRVHQNSQRQFDNQSVHSVNSRKSKGKTKQSTLSIKKKQQNQLPWQSNRNNQNQIFKLDSDEDNKSVNSHASRNSKKSKVKQNSLGKNKVEIKTNYYQAAINNANKIYPKNQERSEVEDYSKVQTVELDDNRSEESPKVIKYQNRNNYKIDKPRNKNNQMKASQKGKNYSPFEEITLNRQQEDDRPVFVVKQQKNNPIKKNQIKKDNQLAKQANGTDKNPQNQFLLHQEQNNNLLDTKSLAKTRRNKIFQNGNNSKSNIDSCQLNLSSNFQKSRSKSKSKLGGLLKDSRQKKFNESKVQNFSNLYSNQLVRKEPRELYSLEQQSNKQKNHMNEKAMKITPIQRKQVIQNQMFDLGMSQSDLNLSNSIKKDIALHQKQRDSVHFNFQREREYHKKGLSITSKDKNKEALYSQIQGSLNSKKGSHIERLKKKQQQSEDILNSILIKSQFKEQNDPRQQRKQQAFQKANFITGQNTKKGGIQISNKDQQFKVSNQQNPKSSQKTHQVQNKYSTQSPNPVYKLEVQKQKLNSNLRQQSYLIKEVARQEINIKNYKKQESPIKIKPQIVHQQIVLERLPSTQTQQISQTKSQKSNSQQKKAQKKVKQNSLNKGKKHTVQVRNQSPRAEESFYESDKQQSKHQIHKHIQTYNQILLNNQIQPKEQQLRGKVQNRKQTKLINFDSQEQGQKYKSKTDSNFYQYCQQSQKSLRPPSSKPPLSKRSNASSSNSKSKPKQTTLKIKKQNTIQVSKSQQNQNKKKSLVQIAFQKNYQGSNYSRSNSQQSFNSRQSGNHSQQRQSVDSKKSKSSKKSFKKQSTLPITIKSKNSTFTSGLGRPPLKKNSTDTNSQIQIFDPKNSSIYDKLQDNKLQKQQREKIEYNNKVNQRKIVSKDTYFIDQNGKLVKRDLIIQGNRAYGIPNSQQQAQQMARSRMQKSRQRHNSRSKSRQKSQSRLSKKGSSSSSNNQSGYQSNYSNAISSQSNHFNTNSYYKNFSTTKNQNQYGRVNVPPKTLQQFLKPLQQKPLYKFQKNTSKKIQSEFYQNQEKFDYQDSYVQKTTLNQLFGRGQDQSRQTARKKSLHRTQKHTSKR